jgi:hypothetical protein
MDYDLELDEYGYYITTELLWTNKYAETSDFQFYKKPYFKIEGSGGLNTILIEPTENVVLKIDGVIQILKFLSIEDDNKFVNFQLSSTIFDTGYIIIN